MTYLNRTHDCINTNAPESPGIYAQPNGFVGNIDLYKDLQANMKRELENSVKHLVRRVELLPMGGGVFRCL